MSVIIDRYFSYTIEVLTRIILYPTQIQPKLELLLGLAEEKIKISRFYLSIEDANKIKFNLKTLQ